MLYNIVRSVWLTLVSSKSMAIWGPWNSSDLADNKVLILLNTVKTTEFKHVQFSHRRQTLHCTANQGHWWGGLSVVRVCWPGAFREPGILYHWYTLGGWLSFMKISILYVEVWTDELLCIGCSVRDRWKCPTLQQRVEESNKDECRKGQPPKPSKG